MFPESVHPERIREDFALFDLSWSDSDTAEMSALNRDERIRPDPDVFDWVPG